MSDGLSKEEEVLSLCFSAEALKEMVFDPEGEESSMEKKVVVFAPTWGIGKREKFPSSVELWLEDTMAELPPASLLEPFLRGVDGIILGDVLSTEDPEGKRSEGLADLISAVISWLGISPLRFFFCQVSRKGGEKVDRFVMDFLERIEPLPSLFEEISEERLKRKIEAAKKGLSARKLPFLLGKRDELSEKGNLFGERFTQLELKRMFYSVISDELTAFELLSLLAERAYSVPELAKLTALPRPQVLGQLSNLRRLNQVDIVEIEGTTPKWGRKGINRK